MNGECNERRGEPTAGDGDGGAEDGATTLINSHHGHAAHAAASWGDELRSVPFKLHTLLGVARTRCLECGAMEPMSITP